MLISKSQATSLRQSIKNVFQELRAQGFLTLVANSDTFNTIRAVTCPAVCNKPYVHLNTRTKKRLGQLGYTEVSFGLLHGGTVEQIENIAKTVIASLKQHDMLAVWRGNLSDPIMVFAEEEFAESPNDIDPDAVPTSSYQIACYNAARNVVIAHGLGLLDKVGDPVIRLTYSTWDCKSLYWDALFDPTNTSDCDILAQMGLPDTHEGRETIATLILADYPDGTRARYDAAAEYLGDNASDSLLFDLQDRVENILSCYVDAMPDLIFEVSKRLHLSQSALRVILSDFPPTM